MAQLTDFQKDTPRTEIRDAVLSNISDDLPAQAVTTVEELSEDSHRQATLTGELVDFATFKEL